MVAPQRRSFALLLLLAIFLMVQSAALAHTVSHDLHPDADHCSTCLRAGQYKAIAVDTSTAPVPAFSAVSLAPQTASPHPADRPFSARARAPPSSTMR
jgi:hypothetical protein